MTSVMTTTASRALTGARRRAGLVVRSRIAGEDAAEKREREKQTRYELRTDVAREINFASLKLLPFNL